MDRSRLTNLDRSRFEKERTQYKLSQDVRSKPSIVSFCSALLKYLDQKKITSEPWHSGSNGRMSIIGYLPKNRSTPIIWDACPQMRLWSQEGGIWSDISNYIL